MNGVLIPLEKNLSLGLIRLFSKLRKLANWQLADRHINCHHRGPETDFYEGFDTSFISVQNTK